MKQEPEAESEAKDEEKLQQRLHSNAKTATIYDDKATAKAQAPA